jgi:hypothetical protein
MPNLQKLLAPAAGTLIFGAMVYWVWAGMFDSLAREDENLRRDMERLNRVWTDIRSKRDREMASAAAKRREWIAKHEAEMEALRKDLPPDYAALIAKAKDETAALRKKAEEAREKLRVDKSEVQIRSEVRRMLNEAAGRHKIPDTDRQINVSANPGRNNGWTEVTATFDFKVVRDDLVPLLHREIDEALPYMAVDSLSLAPVSDGETDPAKKRFLLKGKLLGYVIPTE